MIIDGESLILRSSAILLGNFKNQMTVGKPKNCCSSNSNSGINLILAGDVNSQDVYK
jgi:hypothetical protein